MESLHEHKKVSISCPICRTKKVIEVPISIIEQSKQLTTIAIPKGKVCKHHFQVFIDKKFIIRGFQKVDYEIKEPYVKHNNLHTCDKKMSLKEIYEEFWEYISDNNETFRNFISIDRRRNKNLNQIEINNPNTPDVLPHVCKNLD